MQRHQVPDDVLLDLLDLAARPSLGVGRDPQPLLAGALHKDDLVLARLEQVADDDLVPVPLERTSCFRDEDCWVRLELRAGERASVGAGGGTASESERGRTLNDTMKPSLLHSSTIVLSTLGTWSISMTSEPLPDWILCSDCEREELPSQRRGRRERAYRAEREGRTILVYGMKKSLTAAAR